MPVKVLVTGARDWTNQEAVYRELDSFPDDTIVIEGGAAGADRCAKVAAIRLAFGIHTHLADWAKYGKAAGPIRNAEMLKEQPDIVIAFHTDLEHSKGTKDMVTKAIAAGIPVRLITA